MSRASARAPLRSTIAHAKSGVMPVKHVPERFHTVTPYLVAAGVGKLLDFLKSAFDAKEIERQARPDGVIMHAQVQIGDSMIMMGDPTCPTATRCTRMRSAPERSRCKNLPTCSMAIATAA
jgi:uncharacterized glyoxalase superfamily protein PhnB